MYLKLIFVILISQFNLYADESLIHIYISDKGNDVYYNLEDNKCYEAISDTYGFILEPIKCEKNNIPVTNKEKKTDEKTHR